MTPSVGDLMAAAIAAAGQNVLLLGYALIILAAIICHRA